MFIENLKKLVRLEQAELMNELGRPVKLSEVHAMVGNFCGVSPTTISMIKSGTFEPTDKVKENIALYFRKSVEEMEK